MNLTQNWLISKFFDYFDLQSEHEQNMVRHIARTLRAFNIKPSIEPDDLILALDILVLAHFFEELNKHQTLKEALKKLDIKSRIMKVKNAGNVIKTIIELLEKKDSRLLKVICEGKGIDTLSAKKLMKLSSSPMRESSPKTSIVSSSLIIETIPQMRIPDRYTGRKGAHCDIVAGKVGEKFNLSAVINEYCDTVEVVTNLPSRRAEVIEERVIPMGLKGVTDAGRLQYEVEITIPDSVGDYWVKIRADECYAGADKEAMAILRVLPRENARSLSDEEKKVLPQAERLTAQELWAINKKQLSEETAKAKEVFFPNGGEQPFVVINARLFDSFKAIKKEVIALREKGLERIIVLGAFRESKMSEKVARGNYDIRLKSGDTFLNLYLDRDESGKVISVVRDLWPGNKDLSAAAFALANHLEPNPNLGGKEEFAQMLEETGKSDIYLDLVPHSTAVDAGWLRDERLQEGLEYWYVNKDIPQEYQVALSSLDKVRNLLSQKEEAGLTDQERKFAQLCDKILSEAPGYFLHYSTKLGKWILIVLSRDATMKPKGRYFYDLQALLDLSNPEVRCAITQIAVELANMGVDGFRVDSAQMAVVGMLGEERGFLNTWRDHIGEKDYTEQRELYAELIHAVRRIAPGFYFFAEAFWFFDVLEKYGFDSILQLHVYNLLVRKKDIPELRRYFIRENMEEQRRRVHSSTSHDDQPNFLFERKANPEEVKRRFRNQSLVIAALPGIALFYIEQLKWGYLVTATNRNLVIKDTPHPEIKQIFNEEIIPLARDPLFRWGELFVFNNRLDQVFAFSRYGKGKAAIVVSNQSGIISKTEIQEICKQRGASWDEVKKLFEQSEPGEERLALRNNFDDLIEQIPLPKEVKEEIIAVLLRALCGEEVKDIIPVKDAAYQLGIDATENKYYVLTDRLTGKVYLRRGKDLITAGLYVSLEAHALHLFMIYEIEENISGRQQVLEEIIQRAKAEALSLEDIYLLLKEFGLRTDFPCEGDVSKAQAVKFLVENLPSVAARLTSSSPFSVQRGRIGVTH